MPNPLHFLHADCVCQEQLWVQTAAIKPVQTVESILNPL